MWFSLIPLLTFQSLRRLHMQTTFSKLDIKIKVPDNITFIPYELQEMDYQDLLLFLN